jgi:hypothetical protein
MRTDKDNFIAQAPLSACTLPTVNVEFKEFQTSSLSVYALESEERGRLIRTSSAKFKLAGEASALRLSNRLTTKDDSQEPLGKTPPILAIIFWNLPIFFIISCI